MGALYSGLFSADSGKNLSDVTPSCPTSNCQYPVFQSLALCCTCRNATSTIKSNCSEVFEEEVQQDIIHCEFRLPNGVQVNASTPSHPYDPKNSVALAHEALTIVGTGIDYCPGPIGLRLGLKLGRHAHHSLQLRCRVHLPQPPPSIDPCLVCFALKRRSLPLLARLVARLLVYAILKPQKSMPIGA
jgi:hypothetical protein